MSPYYQASNKMPLGGVVLLLLGGTVAALALAFVYIYAIWYIPFVYINFLLCIGFGLMLGYGLARLVRAGKLRSPSGVGLLAGAVGLVAVYLEWGVYLTLLFGTEADGPGPNADTTTSFSPSVFAALLAQPSQMWEAIRQLNQTGSWSLKGATPSGIFLAAIWLLEALILIGGVYLVARAQAEEPFSEAANTWADEETLAHPVGFAHDAASLRTQLESGQFHALTPHITTAAEEQFSLLKLHSVADDDSCRYLTLENVTKTLDKKGKPTQSTATVVQRLAISSATYHELKKRFGQPPAASRSAEE